VKRASLCALTLLLAAGPARAWRLWGEPSDRKIRPVQELSDARKPAEVLAALTPQFMQTLRGTDLRQAYVLMGDNLTILRRPDQALSTYQLGVSLFPKNVDLLTRQAGLLHDAGLNEQAKPLFLKALQFEPQHFGAHKALAEIEMSLGFPDRAAEHYEIALEVLEKRADVWRDYAEVLLSLGDSKTALLAIERALALEPSSKDLLVLKAFILRVAGDHAGAVNCLDLALAQGAGAGARRAKALWLLEAGRREDAASEAEKVLAEAPGDAAALWVLARGHLAAGRPGKAVEALTLAAGSAKRDSFSLRAATALRAKARELQELRLR